MNQRVPHGDMAARLLFLFAITPARDYDPEQAAGLCALSLPETEELLSSLAEGGWLVECEKDVWRLSPERNAEELAGAVADEAWDEGALKYGLLLRAGHPLPAVDMLLTWAEGGQESHLAGVMGFAAMESAHTLLRLRPHEYGEQEKAAFIELAIRACSLADVQGLEPRLIKKLLLKARGLAFRLNSTSSLHILDTILAVRNMLLTNAPADPLPAARACDGNPDMPHDSRLLAAAMPYISMHNYLQGSARQALDHFFLTGWKEQPVSSSGHENSVPQRAFSSAFAALAAVQSGNVALAVSILRTALNSNARHGGCVVRSWLYSHLATVYLAAGRPDEALEHVDAALDIGVDRDIQCWMAAHTSLAHYHVLCGRASVARNVLQSAVQIAAARKYLWGYNSPYFLDMLYVFRRNALPDIPGYPLERELSFCENGKNPLLRAVAGRIRGDMLLRSGAPLRTVRLPLLRSRAFFKIQQLPVEKCKTCAVLAQACLTAGDRAQALRYAIEAWACHEQFLPLGIYWSPELEKLLPSRHLANEAPEREAAFWRQDFFKSLLLLNPEQYESFPYEALKCVALALGADRAALFDADESGQPRAAQEWSAAPERAGASERSVPLPLVKECLEGVPVRVSALREAAGTGQRMVCIPIPDEEGHFYALYGAGRNLRAEDMDDAFWQLLGEYVGVLFRRWREAASRAREAVRLLAVRKAENAPGPLVFASEAMRQVLRQADTAALSDASVLIYGESGVGKELVARRIHEKSGRKGPFVAVNLSSLPDELFESEMQGYERGAFTGAFQRKIGLLEMADGGTLFMDEVPDISARVQVKLLRLLQERSFMRLGSTRVLHSDFRLIVATNRNLFTEMRQGSFRSDLFYRICVIPLFIPPLRERPEDIDALIVHYFREFSRGREMSPMDPDVRLRLRNYAWPGNIRELRNVMERAVILAGNGRLNISFDNESFGTVGQTEGSFKGDDGSVPPGQPGSPESVGQMVNGVLAGLPSARELEKRYITLVLRLTDGKISGRNGAASVLGMSRSTLYDKMRALGLSGSGEARTASGEERNTGQRPRQNEA